MRANIIQIGNSKGIRIPKTFLELCHIQAAVDVHVKGNNLVIHPIRQVPRTGWEKVFQQMHERHEDRPLMNDAIDLDIGEWEW